MAGTAPVDPIANPQAWDHITVSGVNSPLLKDGKIDSKREYKWDVKEGKGAKGATETFVGVPPAKINCTFVLWTPKDFATWDSLAYILTYDPTKSTTTTTPAAPAKAKAGTTPDPSTPAATTSTVVPANAKGAPAFDIYHPALAAIGVTSVITVSIGAVSYVGNGEYNVSIELMEFTIPPTTSTVATPATAQPGTPTPATQWVQAPATAGQSAQTGQGQAAAQAQYAGAP